MPNVLPIRQVRKRVSRKEEAVEKRSDRRIGLLGRVSSGPSRQIRNRRALQNAQRVARYVTCGNGSYGKRRPPRSVLTAAPGCLGTYPAPHRSGYAIAREQRSRSSKYNRAKNELSLVEKRTEKGNVEILVFVWLANFGLAIQPHTEPGEK
jgi:hypothetical protein